MRIRTIYTIGHSTRGMDEFLDVLKHYNIELVIDVRKFPSSKKFPWFNKDDLASSLGKNGIEYLHHPGLGGYRKEGYANFAKSDEFERALDNLLEKIDDKTTAILCAELFWFRCHRRYITQKLVKRGHKVVHIFDKEKIQEHKSHDKDVNEKMNLVIWCDKKVKIKNEKNKA